MLERLILYGALTTSMALSRPESRWLFRHRIEKLSIRS